MKTVIIREAEENDFESFKNLNKEIQNIHYQIDSTIFKPITEMIFSIGDYKQILGKETNKVFIACDGDIVIGYAYLENVLIKEDALKYARHFILIHHLVISENSRNQGIGMQLLEAVMSYAKKINIHRVEIDVWNGNSNAKNAYLKMGFTTFRERLSIKI
jgi:GNAT superfamily N-acetyltransferase